MYDRSITRGGGVALYIADYLSFVRRLDLESPYNERFHKKQAIQHDSQSQLLLCKSERNKVNIEIRKAKSKYFCEKIQHCTLSKNVKKSWSLINAISGRKRKSPSIKELLINDTIVSDDKVKLLLNLLMIFLRI